jgi:hypothetical protein
LSTAPALHTSPLSANALVETVNTSYGNLGVIHGSVPNIHSALSTDQPDPLTTDAFRLGQAVGWYHPSCPLLRVGEVVSISVGRSVTVDWPEVRSERAAGCVRTYGRAMLSRGWVRPLPSPLGGAL